MCRALRDEVVGLRKYISDRGKSLSDMVLTDLFLYYILKNNKKIKKVSKSA